MDSLFRITGTLLFLFASCLSACGQGEAEVRDTTVRDGRSVLRDLVERDPTLPLLEEIERLAEAHPARAAALLASGAIPAARSHVQRIQTANLIGSEAQSMQRRAQAAFQQRLRALVTYQRLLSASEGDDLALADCLRAQSDAEREIAEVHYALERSASEP